MQQPDKPIDPSRSAASSTLLSETLLWLIWVVWLPFLLPPLVGLFSQHPAPVTLDLLLLLNGGFAALYLWATLDNSRILAGRIKANVLSSRARWAVAIGLALLGVGITLQGGSSSWMSPFIFTSAYLGGAPPGPSIRKLKTLRISPPKSYR